MNKTPKNEYVNVIEYYCTKCGNKISESDLKCSSCKASIGAEGTFKSVKKKMLKNEPKEKDWSKWYIWSVIIFLILQAVLTPILLFEDTLSTIISIILLWPIYGYISYLLIKKKSNAILLTTIFLSSNVIGNIIMLILTKGKGNISGICISLGLIFSLWTKDVRQLYPRENKLFLIDKIIIGIVILFIGIGILAM